MIFLTFINCTNIEILIKFTKDGDIKCRHHAVYTIGNLCSNKVNLRRLVDSGCMKILISFSFPSQTGESSNAQFQAIAGLRGLATNSEYRKKIVVDGGLEPLILSASLENCDTDIEVKREAAAVFCNLALSVENKAVMSRSGVISALVKLLKLNDGICKVNAAATLANLAELEGNIQKRMLDEGCLKPLLSLAESSPVAGDANREVSRCLALFACNPDSHPQLIQNFCFKQIVNYLDEMNEPLCLRFASLAIGNLAIEQSNHQTLFESGAISALLLLAESRDVETTQGIAFALSNLTRVDVNHRTCEKMGIINALVKLLQTNDYQTQIQATLAVRYLCSSFRSRIHFVEVKGLIPLLKFARIKDVNGKREVAAALRNISLFDDNKVAILNEGGLDALIEMSHSSDNEVSHQACGVIANLAEMTENIARMIGAGVLHHLKYCMRLSPINIKREALRAIANLASDESCISKVVGGGSLVPLTESLSSPDIICQRFAAMGLSNIATNEEIQEYIFQAEAVVPLLKILDNHRDNEAQRYALFCLTNIAAVKKNHPTLLEFDIINLVYQFLDGNDCLICESCILCLANLASNTLTHSSFSEGNCLSKIIALISSDNNRIKFEAVSALRGLSTSDSLRTKILELNGLDPLLKLTTAEDVGLQMEVLSTLCNLSLEGCIGDNALGFLNSINLSNLTSFLCSADSTYRLFGALAIGNITSNKNLQEPVLKSGVLSPLLNVSNSANVETQRCIAYAICNLAAIKQNRPTVVREGGLSSIILLSCTDNAVDVVAGLATLRGLAADSGVRRKILQEGALEGISCGASISDNHDCQVEAASLLCALSLNNENKVDIMKCDFFDNIIKLTKSKSVKACRMALRSIGNICEDENLHFDVLRDHGVSYLMEIISNQNNKLTSEVARCFANLSANYSTHSALTEAKVPSELCHLIEGNDPLTSCYASTALMNISMQIENHAKFGLEDTFSVLHGYVQQESKHAEENESKLQCLRNCYLAIGGLCLSAESNENFVKKGFVSTAIESLLTDDKELCLNCVFALSKLATNEKNLKALGHGSLFCSLNSIILKSDLNTKAYAISILRKVSLDRQNCQLLLDSNGLGALAFAYSHDNLDIRREFAACICHLSVWEEQRMILVKSLVLEPLLTLSQYSDVEVARFALGAIANIAEVKSSHQILIEQKNIIHFLVLSSRNRSVDIHREATRALSNLLSSLDGRKEFLSERGLQSLFAIARSVDVECQYNAALCLRKLVSDHSNHNKLVAQGSLKSIILLTDAEDLGVQLQALSALKSISSNQEMKVEFVEQGGLSTSISLLTKSNLKIRTIAMGVLQNLSVSSKLKHDLSEENTIASIVNIGIKEVDDDILRHCAGTISNLSQFENIRGLMIKQNIVDVMIRLAKIDDSITQSFVARAFSYFSCNDVIYEILKEASTIETILHILLSQEEDCAREASNALGNLAKNESMEILISKCGCFRPLILQLKSKHESVQIKVCRALHRLTISNHNKAEIVKQGGLENLLVLLKSANPEVCKMCAMVICNISTHVPNRSKIVEKGGLMYLIKLLQNRNTDCKIQVLKALSNLSGCHDVQAHIVDLGGLCSLLRMVSGTDLKCLEIAGMVLCNVAMNSRNHPHIVEAGILQSLIKMASPNFTNNIRKVAVLALYNLSDYETCHLDMTALGIVEYLVDLCNSDNLQCKQHAIMLLSNLAANVETRQFATKGGGLQSGIKLLKDANIDCNRYACICLANMGNSSKTQSQILVHGGLPKLIQHANNSDLELKRASISCLVNLCCLEANHPYLLKSCILNLFIDQFNSCDQMDIRVSCGFGIANLCSNDEILSKVGEEGSLKALMHTADSDNVHARCLALNAIRRLSTIQQNREKLFELGILTILIRNENHELVEIEREISASLCNLSLSKNHRVHIAKTCIEVVTRLSQSKDNETVRQSSGALANVSEDVEIHDYFKSHGVLECIRTLLQNEDIDIYREALRTLSNILTSIELHGQIITTCLSRILSMSANTDLESQLYFSLSLRKLSMEKRAHKMISKSGFVNMFTILRSKNIKAKKNIAITIRDFCGNEEYRMAFAESGGIEELLGLFKHRDIEVQTLAVSALRHLSCCDNLKHRIVDLGAIGHCKRCIPWATEDLECQIAGLFSHLSENSKNQRIMLEQGVTPIVVSLSKTKNEEIKQVRSMCPSINLKSKFSSFSYSFSFSRIAHEHLQICVRLRPIRKQFTVRMECNVY